MSYIVQRYGRKRSRAMGDVTSTVSTVITGVALANDLSKDPYFNEAVCRFGQLQAITNGKAPGACANTQLGLKGGVGLGGVIQPLRAYVYAEQHRWVYGAAVVGIIGIPMLIGYALGKTSR
jgi:hypothetical protein